MPAKNSRKAYAENGYYHLYNRGVEKRAIFLDSKDYGVFLSYLKEYLQPKDEKDLNQLSNPSVSYQDKYAILKRLRLNNFDQNITLLAYCLMPNHFHLFVKQKNLGAIGKFMNSLCTRYTMYFNWKYQRVGTLYQGVYKAVLITDDTHFLHLSKYIHLQAIGVQEQPSSFAEYTGKRKTDWVHPEEVLLNFSVTNQMFSYESFVLEMDSPSLSPEIDLDEGA